MSFRFATLSSTTRMDSPAMGEHRGEDRPGRDGGPDADASALGFDQPFRERQSEAGARILLGRARVELLERDEEPADVGRGDADPCVLNLEAESVRPFRNRADGDAPILGRELEGVREIVVEDLFEKRYTLDVKATMK